jgi:hypothetical protein
MTLRDSLISAFAVLVLTSCGGGCDDELPEEDVCANPRAGTIESVQVGRGLTAIFMPLAEDQPVHLIQGDQLLFMLPVRYRFTGSDIPACVDQRASLRGCPGGVTCADGPIELARSVAPLWTYPEEEDEEDAARETKALYLVLTGGDPDPGGRLELHAEVAGHTLDVGLWVEEAGPDAPADAAVVPVDAAPPADASVDAAPPDAMVDAMLPPPPPL